MIPGVLVNADGSVSRVERAAGSLLLAGGRWYRSAGVAADTVSESGGHAVYVQIPEPALSGPERVRAVEVGAMEVLREAERGATSDGAARFALLMLGRPFNERSVEVLAAEFEHHARRRAAIAVAEADRMFEQLATSGREEEADAVFTLIQRIRDRCSLPTPSVEQEKP